MRRQQRDLFWVAKNIWWASIVIACVLPEKSYSQTEYVQPIDWAKYAGKTGVQPGDAFGQTLVTVLQNEARYELNWLNTQPVRNDVPGWVGSDCYYPDFSYPSVYIEAERPLAVNAYGMAVQIKTGIYDPNVTGVSVNEAIHRAELAIRGVAFTNMANAAPSATYKWGGTGPANPYSSAWHNSQNYGTWAAQAAWMLWDHIGSDTQLAVSKMMEREADYIASQPQPLYWADKTGSILYPGDTQQEEDAWCGHMLTVAQAMMPNHTNANLWRQKASQWNVASYSRQSDLSNTTLVDGKPVKDYLNGFNVFPDGVLVNHGFVHPDYIFDDHYRTIALVDVSLAGQYAVESAVFNADLAYSALTELPFTPGPDAKYGTGRTIVSPGGTIFKRTENGDYKREVYYPENTDWTYLIGEGSMNTDLMAEYLGLDTGKSFDAMGWARVRADWLRELQTRPGHDGNIYETGDWITTIRDPEECMFSGNTGAWMQWWMMQNNLFSPISDHWGAIHTPEPGSMAALLSGGLVLLAWRLAARKRRSVGVQYKRTVVVYVLRQSDIGNQKSGDRLKRSS